MRTFLAVLLCAVVPATGSAQERDDLISTFHAVATNWARSDADGVLRYMTPSGVSMDVSDGPMGPLGERQAEALLRQLFDQGETVRVETGMLEQVGGTPARAFGAITWTTRPEGTRVPVERTVYFGLEWTRGAWRVAEIRLIP